MTVLSVFVVLSAFVIGACVGFVVGVLLAGEGEMTRRERLDGVKRERADTILGDT